MSRQPFICNRASYLSLDSINTTHLGSDLLLSQYTTIELHLPSPTPFHFQYPVTTKIWERKPHQKMHQGEDTKGRICLKCYWKGYKRNSNVRRLLASCIRVAQRKRGGPITHRSQDRNLALIIQRIYKLPVSFCYKNNWAFLHQLPLSYTKLF